MSMNLNEMSEYKEKKLVFGKTLNLHFVYSHSGDLSHVISLFMFFFFWYQKKKKASIFAFDARD